MKDKKINKYAVIVIYFFVVAISKIIRYTVMKESLVNYTMGWGWLETLNAGGNKLIISLKGESVATQNSIAIFQVFRYLGMDNFYNYEFMITIIFNLIVIGFILKMKNEFSYGEFFTLMCSVAVLNIWNFCLSKEPVQMIFFCVIAMIIMSKIKKPRRKYILSLLVIILSTYIYRNYYILIIPFSVMSYVILDKIIKRLPKISYKIIVLILIAYGLMYYSIMSVTKIAAHDIYDTLVYLNTNVTEARTDISGIFNTDNLILGTIDYLLVVVRMLFPVELIRLGPKYCIYVAFQFSVTFYLIKSLKNIGKNSSNSNIAIYIFLGFLFMSGAFEPDFGSWVRHESVTFPVLMIALNFMEKEGQNENLSNDGL